MLVAVQVTQHGSPELATAWDQCAPLNLPVAGNRCQLSHAATTLAASDRKGHAWPAAVLLLTP